MLSGPVSPLHDRYLCAPEIMLAALAGTMRRSMRALVLLAAALLPDVATADLRDRSLAPDSDLLLWPKWYRDTNNLALGLCKSQVASANVEPGPDPTTMCLPLEPDPAGFAGNIGGENFYNLVRRYSRGSPAL